MMFSLAADHLAEQVSGEELIPCRSIVSSTSLKRLSMVERDAFGKYTITGYTINDLVTDCKKFKEDEGWSTTYLGSHDCSSSMEVTSKLYGEVANFFDLKLDNIRRVTWSANFGRCTLEQLDLSSFVEHFRTMKLNKDHLLIQECLEKDAWYKITSPALGVVTAVLKSETETILTAIAEPMTEITASSNKKESTGAAGITFSSKNKHTLTIPAGTVMAYQIKELLINIKDGTIEKISKRGGLSKKKPTGDSSKNSQTESDRANQTKDNQDPGTMNDKTVPAKPEHYFRTADPVTLWV